MADDEELSSTSPFKEVPEPKATKPKPGGVKQLFERKPRQQRAAPKTRRGQGKVNMAEGISLVYGGLGTAIGYSRPEMRPVGTTMQLMAPYAGKQLNKAISRSDTAYKLLSPIFGRGQTASELGSALLPPIIVYAITNNPASAVTLMPLLRMLMRPALVEMAKEMAKEKETLQALMGDEEGAEVEGELDNLLNIIFSSMMPPEEQPESDVEGRVVLDGTPA